MIVLKDYLKNINSCEYSTKYVMLHNPEHLDTLKVSLYSNCNDADIITNIRCSHRSRLVVHDVHVYDDYRDIDVPIVCCMTLNVSIHIDTNPDVDDYFVSFDYLCLTKEQRDVLMRNEVETEPLVYTGNFVRKTDNCK